LNELIGGGLERALGFDVSLAGEGWRLKMVVVVG